MGQSRPLFVYFCIFLRKGFYFQKIFFVLKKRRWCAWDLNPRLQNGRRKQYHGAMAAALGKLLVQDSTLLDVNGSVQP